MIRFCPQGHDTFAVGRSRGWCNACHRRAVRTRNATILPERARLNRRWRARTRRRAEIHAAWSSWIGGQRLRMAGVRWGQQPAFPHDSWALR